MAQFTFDTNDPADMVLMHTLAASGLLPTASTRDGLDLVKAIDALLSGLGRDAQVLIAEFVVQTSIKPTTLEEIALARGIDLKDAKSKKMNFGRAVKKVRKQYPGLPDPIRGEQDSHTGRTRYTMDDDIRQVMDAWFKEKGLLEAPQVIQAPVLVAHGSGEDQTT